MITKVIHENFPQYTFESIGRLTLDQLFILAATEKEIRFSSNKKKFTGDYQELKSAGLVDEEKQISLLEYLTAGDGISRKEKRAKRLQTMREALKDVV